MYYLKIIAAYIFIASTIAFTIFGSSQAKADVYLLGDSWLSTQTFNTEADFLIGFWTGATVVNHAVNSQSSANLAAEISTYGMQDDGVAIIDIGLPDFFNGVTKTTIQNNMFVVVDYLFAHNIETVLSCPADATSPTNLAAKIAQKKLKPAWNMCQTIADRHPGFIHVIDVQSQLMPIVSLDFAPGDAVHLNEDGYHIFNIAVSMEVRRMKGYCFVVHNPWWVSDGIISFYNTHPMDADQKCTTVNMQTPAWVKYINEEPHVHQ